MGKNRHPVAFISHANVDKARFVIPFSRALREEWGIDVWVDEWEMTPGDLLADKVFDGIERADAFVIVLSENSINSSWVKEEINSAVMGKNDKGMRIIPVVLDGLNRNRLPRFVRGLYYMRWNSDEHIDAASEVARIIRGDENPEKPSLGSFP